jgi:hypothetical protein
VESSGQGGAQGLRWPVLSRVMRGDYAGPHRSG